MDERLHAAYAARTRSELEPLIADLQVLPAGVAAPAGTFAVKPGEGGAQWLISFMSGCDRRGHWRLGRLDCNHAEFAAQETAITVFNLMGGADIKRGLRRRDRGRLHLTAPEAPFRGGRTSLSRAYER
jgi:hypothetical protein